MGAGELRQRIKIEANTPTTNDVNEPIARWSTFAEVWAKIETVGGTEFIANAAAGARLSHKIKIRWLEGLKPTMRVNWNFRYFRIEAILSGENVKRSQVLVCSEIVI